MYGLLPFSACSTYILRFNVSSSSAAVVYLGSGLFPAFAFTDVGLVGDMFDILSMRTFGPFGSCVGDALFSAVERFVHPLLLEERNIKKKIPREVFDDEHKQLVKEGEKWMRDTASSCMVVDALIIAMVFAAMIAVPGNNEKGIPNFRHETLFKIFIISDAVALFSSSFSLLSFLRILTSRYAEEDIVQALPKLLLLGLITLILSIATMLVAASSALTMLIDSVPGPKVMLRKATIVPVTIMATLPAIFFIWSQSHLLIDLLLSTYRPDHVL
ncbi:hypothetical protein DITRI_Ditri15bG0021900 [Diplodiscus trichospermus]